MIVGLSLAALLSGCVRQPPSSPPAAAVSAAAAAPAAAAPAAAVVLPAAAAVDPLTVSEQEAGRTVELVIGQDLIVRLAANPSTGFGWALHDGSGQLLALLGDAVYEAAPATADMVGGGGTEIWRLRALAPGRQELRFVYRRRFEPDVPPALRVSYAIVVR